MSRDPDLWAVGGRDRSRQSRIGFDRVKPKRSIVVAVTVASDAPAMLATPPALIYPLG